MVKLHLQDPALQTSEPLPDHALQYHPTGPSCIDNAAKKDVDLHVAKRAGEHLKVNLGITGFLPTPLVTRTKGGKPGDDESEEGSEEEVQGMPNMLPRSTPVNIPPRPTWMPPRPTQGNTKNSHKDASLEIPETERGDSGTYVVSVENEYGFDTEENPVIVLALLKEQHEEVLCNTIAAELLETEFQCGICREVIVRAMLLKCSHTFCSLCIRRWMKVKMECPVCRRPITGYERDIRVDSFIEKQVEKLDDEGRTQREKLLKKKKNGRGSI